MRLRTARRGRNAGNQFWGCSRYPDCQGSASLVSDMPNGDSSESVSPPLIMQRAFPVRVNAEPRQQHNQTTFFQACGLPAKFVKYFHDAEVDRSLVRAAAQWRLDFPMPHGQAMPPGDRDLLAIAEALLTRGATPLCSPRLERELGVETLPLEHATAAIEGLRRVAFAPSCRLDPLSFDSVEERKVFEWVQAYIDSRKLPWTLIPQVNLASISQAIDPRRNERGDLLLVHPECNPVLIEVDGKDHRAHFDRDQARDAALGTAGVRVIRVQTDEARNGRGMTLDAVAGLLVEGQTDLLAETEFSRTIRWCKFVHQIQLALLTALRGGWLRFDTPWSIGVVLPAMLQRDRHATRLIRLAVTDLAEMLYHLARLHDRPLPTFQPQIILATKNGVATAADVLIGPADGSVDSVVTTARARFLISDVCFPQEIQAPLTAASPARLANPQREDARWFLQYVFRKDDFLEGQWETIERTLRGFDSVVLLPTGAGKSIAFQLAALLLPGRCIVVDPIVSLIDDQIDNLEEVGIDRCIGITSQLTRGERESALQAFKSGHYLFCYVAPERFQAVPFRQALRALTTNTPISLIAIDEAHCVSEWGHDFRTAYLNLGRTARDYCASQSIVPPLVALTGTASKIVLKDVQRELGITSFDAIITPKTFDRPELHYSIIPSRSDEKDQRVLGFLERLPTDFGVNSNRFFLPDAGRTYAGLVFCPHADGLYGVVRQAEQLTQTLRTRVEVYSGKPPRNVNSSNWEQVKREIARDFKRNRTALLACTKAFGMGIDKQNIRYTVHIGLPASIESFYQEAGRAGRDRHCAECAIILSNDDPKRSRHLLNPATSLEEVAKIVDATNQNERDDIVRALWFHVRAFRGEQAEVEDIAIMLEHLGNVRVRRQVNVAWHDPRWSSQSDRWDAGRERAEKALHRLLVLGVVEDYTIDYAAREFAVRIAGATQEEIAIAFGRYVGAYQRRLGEQAEREALALRREPQQDYVLVVAERLISFIYQHIELARRRALNEMLQATISARTGEDLRHRILEYLQQTEWDERLEAVRTSARGGLDSLAPILDDLVSPNDAVALRAAASRALVSYPDVPGLLLLRGASEALSPDADQEVVEQNVEAALSFAAEMFQLAPTEVATALGQVITRAHTKVGAAGLLLRSVLISAHANRIVMRELLRHIPLELGGIAARRLMNQLVARCVTVYIPKGG